MPAKIKYAKEYIDTNFCDPALRVALLAEMCGISEVHMRKLFKKYIGCSPIEYIKGCKMALRKIFFRPAVQRDRGGNAFGL